MKKILIVVLFLALVLPVALPQGSTFAVDVINPVCQNADPNNLPTVCKENATGSASNPIFGPDGVLTRVVSIVARLIGVAAVIGIIVSGLRMVLAGGDSSTAKTARSALVYCVVGLLVAILAQGIVSFILSKI